MIPCQVFAAVCGFRCIFPNRYNACVVLHDTWLSSIILTRCLATVAEPMLLYQLSVLATDLNHLRPGGPLMIIDVCAWMMFVLCCVAQCFVW